LIEKIGIWGNAASGLNDGYGYAGFKICKTLNSMGIKTYWEDETAPISLSFKQPPDYGGEDHQFKIGYTPWESTYVPDEWIDRINSRNLFWTTSHWCTKVFKAAGVKIPIRTVIHGIDPKDYTLSKRIISDYLIFFHMGEPADRKNGQMVFDAFNKVFSGNNNVRLFYKANGWLECRMKQGTSIIGPVTDHPQVEAYRSILSIPEMNAMFHSLHCLVYPSCFSDDTRILTENGWKNRSEVFIGQNVATINSSGKMEFCPIIDINQTMYNGQMIHFDNASMDMLLTPNHRVYYWPSQGGTINPRNYENLQVKYAGDFVQKNKTKRYIPLTCKWEGRDDDYITTNEIYDQTNLWHRAKKLPEKIYLPLFFELLGWYISEGCYFDDEEGNSYISISNRNRENLEHIFKLLKYFELNPFIQKFDVRVVSKSLLEIFKSCGKGALNKKIPRWCFEFSPRLLEHLFNGLMAGDGTFSGHNVSYYTSSEQLCDDFIELCVKLGYTNSVFKREPINRLIEGRFVSKDNTQLNYQISVKKTKIAGSIKAYDITYTEYSGMVWCVTNKNHTIIAERNGKVFITGNSGEGFGMIPLQAMATGMPTILPDYSGMSEFAEYGIKLKYTEGPSSHDFHLGNWARPDFNDLCDKMVYVYENYDEVSKQAYSNAKLIRKKFDWKKIISKEIDDLEGRIPKRFFKVK
jgi:glycosyltransferase involved in cell wall biosynthesis